MRVKTSIALFAVATALTSPVAAGSIIGDQNAVGAAFYHAGDRDPDSAIGRTQTLIQAGNFAAAKKLIEPLAADGSYAPDVYYLAGLANLGANQPGQAVRWFYKAGSSTRALHGYALALARSGSAGKAGIVLKQLQARQSQYAGTCEEAGDIDSAVSAVGNALTK